jgi:hypothetical protein
VTIKAVVTSGAVQDIQAKVVAAPAGDAVEILVELIEVEDTVMVNLSRTRKAGGQ